MLPIRSQILHMRIVIVLYVTSTLFIRPSGLDSKIKPSLVGKSIDHSYSLHNMAVCRATQKLINYSFAYIKPNSKFSLGNLVTEQNFFFTIFLISSIYWCVLVILFLSFLVFLKAFFT